MTLPPWIRRSQRVIRMLSDLHKMGFQKLRLFPYEYPLAWRLCIAPRALCSTRNGAYVPALSEFLSEDPSQSLGPTYSSASDNKYFEWTDARTDTARQLAEKFAKRFPAAAHAGQGRDWEYAGWLVELIGVLERGPLLPFVMAEYFEPGPLNLRTLPIRDFSAEGGHRVLLNLPLPPGGDFEGGE